MKKIITTLLLLLLVASPALAKRSLLPYESENRNRLTIGYGDNLYSGVVGAFTTAFVSLVSDVDRFNSPGCFSLGYRRASAKNRVQYGFDVTYSHVSILYEDASPAMALNSIGFMPVIDWHYYRSKVCTLYGTAAIGAQYVFGSANTWLVTGQISPIGVKLGSDKISGFLELGFGFKGVFNLGIQVGL